MKRNKILGLVLVLAILLMLVAAPIASAAGAVSQVTEDPLGGLLAQLAAMGGVASLIAILINTLKQVGVVKDGSSKTWAVGLNLVALIGLYALRIASPDTDLVNVDGFAGSVAQLLTIIVQLVIQTGLSIGANGVVKGLPVIGYSHSAELDKEFSTARVEHTGSPV